MTTALFTDLYELTMSSSYHRHGLDHDATFELCVRSLPERRHSTIAAYVSVNPATTMRVISNEPMIPPAMPKI